MQNLDLDLPLEILRFSAILLLSGLVIWFSLMQKKKSQRRIQDVQDQLDAAFALSGYLLEAQNEQAVVMAALRTGCDFLQADGASFVPFSEFKQSLSILKYGHPPFLQDEGWQERLSQSETRHTCRSCEAKQSGSSCVLLQSPATSENVYCVVLKCGGREIGVVNYFLPTRPHFTETQETFLHELVWMTDLALDTLRLRAQEISSIRCKDVITISEKDVPALLDAENRKMLEQVACRAVLEERTRLAREIHDGLAQTLAFLKMEVTRMQARILAGETSLVDNSLKACYRTLSDAYLDAREAIDDLHQIPDDLSTWLKTVGSNFKALTGIEVDVSNVHLMHMFPPSVMSQTTRIIQEALTNIRKHAKASAVSISAFDDDMEAVIEVKDNGCGFEPKDVLSMSQFGLRSMRERAEIIDAEFQITSATGMGTTLRLQIPIQDKVIL